MRKILIVEDEGDMCLLLNLLLQSENVECSHAKTLSEAHEFLQKEKPSLVLLDNRLPDGFGVDFIQHIKTKYPDMKIIMITGIDPAVQDLALEIGADTFLIKPFTQQQLRQSVNHLLN